MTILVYAEHDNEQLKTETHKLMHARITNRWRYTFISCWFWM